MDQVDFGQGKSVAPEKCQAGFSKNANGAGTVSFRPRLYSLITPENYFLGPFFFLRIVDCAAASRAIGTRKGEQET